ncbi:MAG: phytanoyl-CoA dioxygenase family protein [Candidatus Latescibacterota bacterium]|nr:phytanoyl-CoA dioxygenase family protein [Candidatus Latescibacterota bacterium]
MTATGNLARAYESDGYITHLDIFSKSEIDKFRARFNEVEEREGREQCQIGLQGRHFDLRFLWEMATDPRVVDVVSECMGENIMLLSTHVFCKYPENDAKKFVAWHQDITYWGLEPPEAHTAWIAIDDVAIENGCMQVIPGSHRHGIVEHGKSDREGNLLSINQEIPDELVDKSDVVNIELGAGQASVHHGQLFHASHPNRSQRRRAGLTVRFIPPQARQIEANSIGSQWKPVLLRGSDNYHHYPDTSVPFAPPERN